MKNLLSKSLLCGVLASTFLIVNCQKAPNRAVKAQVTPPAKPAAVKSAECSEGAVKEHSETKKLSDALKTAMDAVKDKATADLTSAEIENLNKLINDLAAQAKKFIAEIQKIQVGDKDKVAADACTIGKDAHNIKVIQSVIADKGKAVKAKTGVDNDVTKPVADAPADSKIELNDELTLTEELAKLLADEAQKDKSAVVAGKILTAEADVKKALENKAVTACKVTLNAADAKDALVKDAKVLVSSLDVKDSADGKRKVAELSLGVKASAEAAMSLIGLSCTLADGKDAGVELRLALGSLVSSVVKATAAKKDEPKAEDKKDDKKDDKKVAAQEGLDILDQAAARQ